MASSRLTSDASADPVSAWRVPKTILHAAFRSSSPLGYDLVYRLRAERYQFFLAGHLALWVSAGILLPLMEYVWILRTPWFLAIAAASAVQCVMLSIGLVLVRHGDYQRSITVVCIGNWVGAMLITLISPPLLPVMVLVALVPVAFAEPYVSLRRGLVFTIVSAVVVLGMTVLARFTQISDAVGQVPHWVETAFVLIALPANALHLMAIVWNNAGALRTSESRLAEHAAELTASRTRLITAADEERRRLERDLHDGAQQHLVALSVLVQLSRNAEHDQRQELLTEASDLVSMAIAEIRRLAHGIYPPLLVSGGLTEALPALAGRASVPVQVNISDLDRYPPSTEAALYYCCSEALQNAVKHAGPEATITVTAGADERVLRLTIADTGTGFDPAIIGTGLTNMTDRLSAIGGRLTIDTAIGRGTRVTAVVDCGTS